jgi:hypothetical protein
MRRNYILAAVAGLLCLGSVAVAQSIDWTIRQVRDPVQLKDKLNSDGTTVEGRLADLEASTNVYIATGLAAFDVSGFTNGVLPAARIPFAAYSIAGFTNGTLASARLSAEITAGMSVTNVIISSDAKTNTIVVRAGKVISWTVGQ